MNRHHHRTTKVISLHNNDQFDSRNNDSFTDCHDEASFFHQIITRVLPLELVLLSESKTMTIPIPIPRMITIPIPITRDFLYRYDRHDENRRGIGRPRNRRDIDL